MNKELNTPLQNTENAEELVERTEVPNSPFTIIGIDDYYFGAMGNYRITEKSDSKELIMAELNQITYNRIVQIMSIMLIDRERIESVLHEKLEEEINLN